MNKKITIKDRLKGKIFNEGHIGLSLEKAIENSEKESIFTCPELLEIKINTDKEHEFWKNNLCAYTEENIGLDENEKPILITIHGGGILTPKRIRQTYEDKSKLVYGNSNLTIEEFYELSKGKIPYSNKEIPMFNFKEIKAGVNNLPHRYGIITQFNLIENLVNGYLQEKPFIANSLAISRAGGTKFLKPYYNLAKSQDGTIGCLHKFKNIDFKQPQSFIVYVFSKGGFGNGNLNCGGFVGIKKSKF